MTTPIVDFVEKYTAENNLRLHMPGHKGKGFLGVENRDITEIDGADILYNAKGIIRESENNAAVLFGTKKTVYSTEGSSLAIRAMLYLVKTYAKKLGKNPIIAAGRNAHKTFVTGCALLGLDVNWLLPQNTKTVISCEINADFLEGYFSECTEKPMAVYVTSPDYLGNISDIAALSSVCKKYGVLLLVDNAHGAYLKFLQPSRHPIDLGADMCCDSAHKTLPVLTGGAYIHISEKAPEFFVNRVETAMSMFASTSPSYLILQSLDMANDYLSNGYNQRLNEIEKAAAELKDRLIKKGFHIVGDEPLKLTLAPKTYGYTGYQLADLLLSKKIVCEFSDPDFVVMMLTLETGNDGVAKIFEALSSVKKRKPLTDVPPKPTLKKKRLSYNVAIYLPTREIDVDECQGRILAIPSVNCPPAIPVAVCGEELDENAVKCFKYYGIKKCVVVDEGYL